MTKKNILSIITGALALIIISFALFIYNTKSCEYKINPPIYGRSNECHISITKCIWEACTGPDEMIKCGDSKKICGDTVNCTCSGEEKN